MTRKKIEKRIFRARWKSDSDIILIPITSISVPHDNTYETLIIALIILSRMNPWIKLLTDEFSSTIRRITISRLCYLVSDFYFDVVIRRTKRSRVDLIARPARNRRSRSITTSPASHRLHGFLLYYTASPTTRSVYGSLRVRNDVFARRRESVYVRLENILAAGIVLSRVLGATDTSHALEIIQKYRRVSDTSMCQTGILITVKLIVNQRTARQGFKTDCPETTLAKFRRNWHDYFYATGLFIRQISLGLHNISNYHDASVF